MALNVEAKTIALADRVLEGGIAISTGTFRRA